MEMIMGGKIFSLLVIIFLIRIQEGEQLEPGGSPVFFQPEQVHLAYGRSPTEMVVTWSTKSAIPRATVMFGMKSPTVKAFGTSKLFVDGGKKKRSQYIHRVTLTNLKPATKYVYMCGGDLGWSDQFWFRAANDSNSWTPVLAVYGDLGNENAKSLPLLQIEAQSGTIDAVIHVGDFAYNMDTDNGRVGDEFMRQIEPIAAYVPYMVCPGNHEQKYNFSHYRERFSMPGDFENLFYSFNLGPAHFVSFDTEAYYYINYGINILLNQYEWITKDLQEANEPESRLERPWIVTYGHKPMYCSNWYREDCTYNTTRVRVGLPAFQWFGLEEVFYKYGVDLSLWGHEHSYERLFPVYDYQVKNGSEIEPYKNPKAPVHITTGSAGCVEEHSNFTKLIHPWSAFRSTDYGYSKLHFLNHSHLRFQQISVDQGGKIIDDIWIVKDRHSSYI